MFSEITEIKEDTFLVKTGDFISKVPMEDMSVILMRDKLEIG